MDESGAVVLLVIELYRRAGRDIGVACAPHTLASSIPGLLLHEHEFVAGYVPGGPDEPHDEIYFARSEDPMERERTIAWCLARYMRSPSVELMSSLLISFWLAG
jgi:hypothetical protein